MKEESGGPDTLVSYPPSSVNISNQHTYNRKQF